jgi:hypothetical protein
LDKDIKLVTKLVPDLANEFFATTDVANQRLIEIEVRRS